MKKLLLALLFSALFNTANAQGNRWYVTKSGTIINNGTSWNTASNDLQAIINVANAGDEIWITSGLYLPIRPASNYTASVDSTNRDNAFVIHKNITLYGGFKGVESSLAERSSFENRTILSGDLKLNDNSNTSLSKSDNAYHVMVATAGNIALDGITITGGNANENSSINVNSVPVSRAYGGGIFNHNANLTLTNLYIVSNYAYNGGGIYIGSSTSSILTNLYIVSNTATNGGGLLNENSDPILTNLTVTGNTATGGGIVNNAANPTIRNSVIWGNGASNIINSGGSTPAYHYSLVEYITANDVNGNIAGATNPCFSNDGSYGLTLISPLIDKGSNAYFEGGVPILTNITKDIVGYPRKFGSSVDLGAKEYQEGFVAISPDSNGILYVNKNVSGGLGDGSSWENALTELGDALKGAESLNTITANSVSQIWVAKGTYYPLYKSAEVDGYGKHTIDYDKTFSLVKDVKVYGGFIGNEADVNLRDWKNNVTILNGDYYNNDSESSPSTMEDNSYHVILSAGEIGSAILDGFTITGGYSNGSGSRSTIVNGIHTYNDRGAGVYIVNSSPALNNLTVTNSKANYGGGLFIRQSYSVISNVAVTNNTAFVSGGGIYNFSSSPTISYLTITNNAALGAMPGDPFLVGGGGGLANNNSNPIISNLLIANNKASNGGGLFNYDSSPTFTNITIANNKAFLGSGMYNGGSSHPTGRNSMIWGNGEKSVYSEIACTVNSYYCLVERITENDEFGNIAGDVDPLFIGNGDYRLSSASPLANRGSNLFYEISALPNISSVRLDLDGNPRIQHGVVDIGAYESSNTSNEADLQKISINSVLHDINQVYIIPCNYTSSTICIDIETPPNASIDISKTFLLDVSKPNLYKVNFTITSLDGSVAKTYTLRVEKQFPFNEIAAQKWNNTLVVNNNPSTNGGHKFTACTWYKNGADVSSKLYYSMGNSAANVLNENDEFYLILTTENGDVLHSCPGSVKLKRLQVTAYPNPVQSGSILNIKVSNGNIPTGTIYVYDLNGQCIDSAKIQTDITPVLIQGSPGMYIIRLQSEDASEDIKVFVQ